VNTNRVSWFFYKITSLLVQLSAAIKKADKSLSTAPRKKRVVFFAKHDKIHDEYTYNSFYIILLCFGRYSRAPKSASQLNGQGAARGQTWCARQSR
jgi:hypothetical protein